MSNFVVHDSSDEQQVKKAQALQEDKDKDLMFVLKEERGRRFLYEIIFNDCHMMANSHVPASSDSSASVSYTHLTLPTTPYV